MIWKLTLALSSDTSLRSVSRSVLSKSPELLGFSADDDDSLLFQRFAAGSITLGVLARRRSIDCVDNLPGGEELEGGREESGGLMFE